MDKRNDLGINLIGYSAGYSAGEAGGGGGGGSSTNSLTAITGSSTSAVLEFDWRDLVVPDTMSVIDNIFSGWSSAKNLPRVVFNDNVTSAQMIYASCSKLESVDLTGFDFSNITTVQQLCYECPKLTSVTIAPGAHSKVGIKFLSVFYNCTSLTSINLNNLEVDHTQNLGNMFLGCTNLTSIDMKNFKNTDSDNLSIISFCRYCSNLHHLDISGLNITKAGSQMSNAFASVPTDCEIIVKDQDSKDYMTERFPTLTNVKIVGQ